MLKAWYRCSTARTADRFLYRATAIKNYYSIHHNKYATTTTMRLLRAPPQPSRFDSRLAFTIPSSSSSSPFSSSSSCSTTTFSSSMGVLARTELYFKETTLQLLCPNTFPLGSLEDPNWSDALETIQFWARRVRKHQKMGLSGASLEAAFQLLDRLVMELDATTTTTTTTTTMLKEHPRDTSSEDAQKEKKAILTESLNLLVDAWRVAWNARHAATPNLDAEEIEDAAVDTIPSPMEIMDRLLRYELRLQPLEPNIRTLNMILHAVANSKPLPPQRQQQQHGSVNDCVEDDPAVLAESMLNRLLSQSHDDDDHDRTTTITAGDNDLDFNERDVIGRSTKDHQRAGRTLAGLRPNTVTWNTVIHAWAQSSQPDAPLKAEAILRRMQQQQQQQQPQDNHDDGSTTTVLATPNIITYNSVLTAWVRSGSGGKSRRSYQLQQHDAMEKTIPQRCEELLQELQEEGLEPNPTTSFLVLQAWADAAKYDVQGPERAHAILRHLLERHDNNDKNHNNSSATTTTTALPSSSMPSSEPVSLNNDNVYSDTDDASAQLQYPLSRCYTMVISAFAARGQADQAEELLYDLCRRYSQTKQLEFFPDVACFNAVLDAWAKQGGGVEAAQRAEAILHSLQRFSQEHRAMLLRPNVISFTSVLDAWARSRRKEAPERCQEILEHMQRLHLQGLADSKPDVRAYHVVIDCWAKSDRSDAPELAERLIRHMYQMYKTGTDPTLKPDMACYNSVLNAWARCTRRSEAADQAQSFFDKIIATYDKSRALGENDPMLKPTLQTYTTLMASWNRSAREDGPEKSQAVYDDLVRRYQEGEESLHPDVVVFNALLDAWAKAGKGERAESLLHEMLERVAQQQQKQEDSTTESVSTLSSGEVVICPNARSFATVINAWAKSGLPDAAERAEGLLRKFQQLTKEGGCFAGRGAEYQPNSHCYNSTLQAWAKSSHPKAVERAALLMAEMVDQNELNKTTKTSGDRPAASVAPNTYSYTFYLQAVDKSHMKNKSQHIRDVVAHLKQQGINVDPTIMRLVNKHLLDTSEDMPEIPATASSYRAPVPSAYRIPHHARSADARGTSRYTPPARTSSAYPNKR